MTEESDDLGEGNSVDDINFICFGNDTSSEDEYVSHSDYGDYL